MAINIGAMFAPSVTEALCNHALQSNGLFYNPALPGLCNALIAGEIDPAKLATLSELAGGLQGDTLLEWCRNYMDTISTGYSYAFAVACGSMILSFLIYKLGASTYTGISDSKADTHNGSTSVATPELTKEQTRSRIVALLLVFTVVIFFWMVFHQNGATLTKFAQQFTETSASGWTRIGFNVWALATIVVGVYSAFSLFQSKTTKARAVSGAVLVASCIGLYLFYNATGTVEGIQPQIYQQFNPFYVVALTPFSVALFTWLGNRKKEPSAPRKIGYGMIVAGVAFGIMALVSATAGLGTAPEDGVSATLVSPNLLIGVYLILTFAELLLSPMGISFVSKVAPPKYKGAMMGCWFGATAIGNYLVVIPTLLWVHIPVWTLWLILLVVCLISAAFIFSIMKKLEAATADVPAADPVDSIEEEAI